MFGKKVEEGVDFGGVKEQPKEINVQQEQPRTEELLQPFCAELKINIRTKEQYRDLIKIEQYFMDKYGINTFVGRDHGSLRSA